MPKTIQKKIWWDPVSGSDVAGYRVYIGPENAPFTYEYPYVAVAAGGPCEIVAPTGFPPDTFAEDAVYSVWITTVDDLGNESDPLALSGAFDFVPPPAPANGGIVDL